MSAQAEINAHMSGLIARSAEIAAMRREEDLDEAVRVATNRAQRAGMAWCVDQGLPLRVYAPAINDIRLEYRWIVMRRYDRAV